MKPKRSLRGQGQGHTVQNFGMHGKVLSQGMCMPHIIGVTQLLYKQLSIFETLTQILKPKRKLRGQGQISQVSWFWHAWKFLVPRHVYAKYKRC